MCRYVRLHAHAPGHLHVPVSVHTKKRISFMRNEPDTPDAPVEFITLSSPDQAGIYYDMQCHAVKYVT